MTRKTIAPEIVTEIRQQAIASLLATHPRITQREIQAWLAGKDQHKPRMINPDTGKPFGLGTINRDVQALRAEYKAKRSRSRDEWIEKLLLDYEDLYLDARKHGDRAEARHVLKSLREVLGVDASARIDVTTNGESINRYEPTEDERNRRLAEILDAARDRRNK